MGDIIALGPHPDFPDLQVVYSRGKQMGWVEPEPAQERLAAYYQAEYRAIRHESPTDAYIAFMRRRAVAQRDFILRHSRTNKWGAVLDIGCGAGLLLEALAPYATQAIGYETDSIMAQWAAANLPGITVHEQHFDVYMPVDRQYDLICMSHVFEHVLKPQEFLAQLQQWLTPGGQLFIEVPNNSLESLQRQLSHGIGGHGHLSWFAPPSLASVVEAGGYQVLANANYGPELNTYWRTRLGNPSLWQRVIRKLWHRLQPEQLDVEQTNGLYLRCLCVIR